MTKPQKLLLALFVVVDAYVASYVVARLTIFHAVEHYAGPELKAGPRQDYIALVDQPAGEGWQYQFFLPMIKLEEAIQFAIHNP